MPNYWKKRHPNKKERRGLGRYRSKFEKRIGEAFEDNKMPFGYEEMKIKYTVPETEHSYTPDFFLEKKDGTDMIIEAKGVFDSADRKKHLLVKQQHPELDIRFIFYNSNSKIYSGSKTTHGAWAKQHGFKFANSNFPARWRLELKKK